VKALGSIGDKRATEVLSSIIVDDKEDEYTQKDAIWSLGEIGGEAAVAPLLSAARNADRKTLVLIAFVLGKLKDDRAVPLLAELLKDGSPADDGLIHISTQPMSQIASEALRRIGGPNAEAALSKKTGR
jgi:HEAT repeat protein